MEVKKNILNFKYCKISELSLSPTLNQNCHGKCRYFSPAHLPMKCTEVCEVSYENREHFSPKSHLEILLCLTSSLWRVDKQIPPPQCQE